MEHFSDHGHLDISRYLQSQSSELLTLQSELARLSSAYYDIETKLPPAPPITPMSEETKSEQLFVSNSPVNVGAPKLREKQLAMLSEELEGEAQSGTLKDIFMRYEGCQNCTVATRLELAQFHCFLRDSGLTPGVTTRAKADVLFFQGNTGKSISFSRWVDILAQIAKSRFKASRSIDCLSRLVLEVILASPLVRSNDLPTGEWETAMARMLPEIGSNRGVLEGIFRLFRSRKANSGGQMSIGNYLIFTYDSHIVPELVSKMLAVRVFRIAQSDSFTEYATFEEFEKMFYFLAFLAFKRERSKEAATQLVKWVNLSAKEMRGVAMRKKLD